jgi:NAD(P)-dependent dehydrogenase (short-subunit alcohol dehydrogenase family)
MATHDESDTKFSQDLSGRVGLVTGAASGLGAATAARLARAGADVGLVDMDADGLERLRGTLHAEGLAVASAVADVRDEESLARAADEACGERAMDFVVACAGIAGEGRADEISVQDWNRVLAIDLTGVWLTARLGVERMQAPAGGSIVMVSSIAGTVGLPGIAAYAAAKGGVVALARQMARDFAEMNIRVNAVCPGPILTPLVEEAWGARGVSIEEGASGIPLRRLGQPDDIAALAHLLVGPDGTWITGETITVDGGISQLIGGAAPKTDDAR